VVEAVLDRSGEALPLHAPRGHLLGLGQKVLRLDRREREPGLDEVADLGPLLGTEGAVHAGRLDHEGGGRELALLEAVPRRGALRALGDAEELPESIEHRACHLLRSERR
jgi:hypothetical protein